MIVLPRTTAGIVITIIFPMLIIFTKVTKKSYMFVFEEMLIIPSWQIDKAEYVTGEILAFTIK